MIEINEGGRKMSRVSEVDQAHKDWGVNIFAKTMEEIYKCSTSMKETTNTVSLMMISRELALLNQTAAIIADNLNEEDK